MLIGANGNLPQSAYADNAVEANTASTASVPVAISAVSSAPLDKITLSAAALRLIEESNQLARISANSSQIPASVGPDSRKAKKRQPSASPMLDVDAFRLIRDKLRAQNLKIREPGPQGKKNQDDKDQATAVSL